MSDTPPEPLDQVQQSSVDHVQELIDSGDLTRLNEFIADNLHSLTPSTQQAVLELIANNNLSSAIGPGLADAGEDEEPGPIGSSLVDEIPDDPLGAATWYANNFHDLSAEDLDAVQTHFGDMAARETDQGLAQAWGQLAVNASEGAPTPPSTGAISQVADDQLDEQLTEAATEWAKILAATPEGETPDVGRLNAYLPAGLPSEAADAFIREAQDRGYGQWEADAIRDAVSQGAGEEEARLLVEERGADFQGSVGTPLWLRKFVGGDRNLTEQVKQRYLAYWNDDHGTNFTSWNQLTPILESMGHTAYTENMTNSVLADQEPLISHSIEIPFMDGAKRLNYTEDEMQALRDMGFNNDAITRLVRLAGLTAGRDAIEPGPNGDTLPISAIAGLLKYYGAGQQFGTYNQISQDINALEAQLGLRPEEYRNMTFKERQALRARLQARLQGDRGGDMGVSEDLAALDKIDAMFRRQAQLEESVDFQGAEDEGQVGVLLAQNNLKRGLDTYNGDSVLAFIHAVDPALAQRIASSGEDPTKLSGSDNARALRIMERGGMLNRGDTMFERLGGRIRTHIFNELSYFDTTAGAAGGGGGGGGAGPIRRVLDPVSIKEQLQKSFAELMLDDVDDAVVTSFTAMLQKQLDNAPEGMSFDVSARIMDWVKGQPGYSELYGNKPEGMTEQEYQGPFMAGVQDMLGAEANPEAVKAGMRENEYQTAVGRAASGAGLLMNSRLRDNWALARQTLDKFS